jgi:hypothetical protein
LLSPSGRRAGLRQGAGSRRLQGPLAEQLVGLRAQGVSAGFAKELREQGLTELSLTNLIALRSQGVTPQYVER